MEDEGTENLSEEVAGGKLPFSQHHAEQILDQLAKAQVALPKRFMRPRGLKPSDHDQDIPETDFSHRKQWGGALRELQDALNSAAADIELFVELTENYGPRVKNLEVIRNSVNRILQRLKEPDENFYRTGQSFDRAFRDTLAKRLDALSGAEEIVELVLGLERLEKAITEMQADLSAKRKKLANLASRRLSMPQAGQDHMTPQQFQIRSYTKVFEDLLELDSDKLTNKGFNDYSGAYPDFIEKVMNIETGWTPSPPTLTKALQRAKKMEQRTHGHTSTI